MMLYDQSYGMKPNTGIKRIYNLATPVSVYEISLCPSHKNSFDVAFVWERTG